MTPDDFAAFDAWLDDVSPSAEAPAAGDLFGRLNDAGERFEAVAAIHPHLVRLVSSEAVLLAIEGQPDPIPVEVLAIERAESREDGDAPGIGRRLVVGAPSAPTGDPEIGRMAQIVYQVGRQLFALECRLREGGWARLVLEYPRAMVYFPGRAFPRVETDLGGRARLRTTAGEHEVRVVDASYGGAGIQTSSEVSLRAREQVALLLEWEGMSVEVAADVANTGSVEGGWRRYGLRFLGTQPLVMRIVRDLLAG